MSNVSTTDLSDPIITVITALKSGDYKQTQGTLHNQEGFCCLGVAAVVLGIATPDEMMISSDNSGQGPYYVYDQLKSSLGSLMCDIGIEMNDKVKSFDEIADHFQEEHDAYTREPQSEAS